MLGWGTPVLNFCVRAAALADANKAVNLSSAARDWRRGRVSDKPVPKEHVRLFAFSLARAVVLTKQKLGGRQFDSNN